MRFMIFYLELDSSDAEVCSIARRVIDSSKVDLMSEISKVLMVDEDSWGITSEVIVEWAKGNVPGRVLILPEGAYVVSLDFGETGPAISQIEVITTPSVRLVEGRGDGP